MTTFSNFKLFKTVCIRNFDEKLISIDPVNNNISLHSSNGTNTDIDTLSIKNIMNKSTSVDDELHICSYDGSTVSPVITIKYNTDYVDLNNKLIKNVANPVDDTDSINKKYLADTINTLNQTASTDISNTLTTTEDEINANTTRATQDWYNSRGFLTSSDVSSKGYATSLYYKKNTQVGTVYQMTVTGSTTRSWTVSENQGGYENQQTTTTQTLYGSGYSTPSGARVYSSKLTRVPRVGTFKYYTYDVQTTTTTTVWVDKWVNVPYSQQAGIVVHYGVYAPTYHIYSDRRIKDNISKVDPSNALHILRNIDTYSYNIINTNRKSIGFIAQEVESILPKSTQTINNYIPDINKHLNNITWTSINIDDKIMYNMNCDDLNTLEGTNYRFIVSDNNNIMVNNKTIEIEIEKNEDGSFTFEKKWNNVYCYGKLVKDFHVIDSSMIFNLYHSAIQEVNKKQLTNKDRIVILKNKIKNIKQKNNNLKNKINVLITSIKR